MPDCPDDVPQPYSRPQARPSWRMLSRADAVQEDAGQQAVAHAAGLCSHDLRHPPVAELRDARHMRREHHPARHIPCRHPSKEARRDDSMPQFRWACTAVLLGFPSYTASHMLTCGIGFCARPQTSRLSTLWVFESNHSM